MFRRPHSSAAPRRSLRHDVARPLRLSALVTGSALLLASCGVNDLSSWSWESDDNDARNAPVAPSATSQPTNTPWAYRPTNTPWTYVTPTEEPWSYQVPTAPATPTRTRTATPTVTPSPTRTPTQVPTPTPTPATDYLALLPTVDDVPGKLELIREDGRVTVDEVGEGFGGDAGLADALRDLDFVGGGLREFALDNPGISEYFSRLLGMQTAVLEFGSAEQAAQAMDLQQSFARSQPDWAIDPKQIDQIADEAIALTGDAEYEGTDVIVVAIFVRDDDRVYRFISISGAYDAWDDTVELARETVGA